MNDSLAAMRLETERLIIRPYRESDLMESYGLMQDEELLTYMHMDVLSFERYEELFRWLLDSYGDGFEEPFKYSFPILAKESGEMVGWCGIGELDFRRPDKELYYLIRRSDWGRGYAGEAAAALAAYGFDAIGLDRLHAKADPRNAASLRVLEKLGFAFSHVLEGLAGDDEDCNGERMHVLSRESFKGRR
ncbi:GNAT family N-acetyltransferase [Paenibacillus sp. D51F]